MDKKMMRRRLFNMTEEERASVQERNSLSAFQMRSVFLSCTDAYQIEEQPGLRMHNGEHGRRVLQQQI
ncbi:unnamed protein product [Arctia plantaginis]|uniref:Uncharacterized protein n=1 Tax=Arctia plantaginis TaxID=874455 RepID=A0A8S1B3C9_ARCPL|nr:unnamed protein product [Arctia plantaginis]